MDFGIQGKTAIVCGASRGLGRACAEALAEEEVNLVVNARDFDQVFDAARSISERYGVEAVPVAADLTRPDTPDILVKAAQDRFGGVDILVNNTGGPPPGTFFDCPDEEWEKAFRLTLMSAVRMTRAALPSMKEKGWGRIVNLTSLAVKQPIGGLILSNALRSAVVGMAKTLSQEVAPHGITVNNIATGTFSTERIKLLFEDRANRQGITFDQVRQAQENAIPAGRIGRPEELAWMVAFLASGRASYITGATIQVDGGMCAGML
jgi:3-oxoacyl-[acyl-carrier protein] reductase